MRTLMIVLSLLSSLTFSSSVLAGELYKIIDDRGRVTYTDKPPPNSRSEKVKTKPINSVPPLKPATDGSSGDEKGAFVGYSSAQITSPSPDQTIGNDQLNVVVQLVLEPQLQEGHSVQFLYDGAPYGGPAAATSYAINGLNRGTHSVSAHVLDQKGVVVAVAPPVTFHVQRHFIRN